MQKLITMIALGAISLIATGYYLAPGSPRSCRNNSCYNRGQISYLDLPQNRDDYPMENRSEYAEPESTPSNKQPPIAEPSTGHEDEELLKKATAELSPGWFIKGYPNVEVAVYNGMIRLSGVVASPEEKAKAEEIVSKINGVKQVFNQIEVSK